MHNLKTAAESAAGRAYVKPQFCADHVWRQPGTAFPHFRAGVQFPVGVSKFTARRLTNSRTGRARRHHRKHFTQSVDCPLRKEIVRANPPFRNPESHEIISWAPYTAFRESRPCTPRVLSSE